MSLYEINDTNIIRSISHLITRLILFISIAWFIVYCFGNQVIIAGQSMAPQLNAEEVCLVNRILYDLGKPSRMDVVVFERPDTGQDNVKRVIGLPGETVQIVSGAIYINNHKLDDPRIGVITSPGIAQNPVVLQKNEYFLLGDNSASSEDSRSQTIGNVKKNNIKGKLWFRLRPYGSMGKIR